jgi:hypothetical protein
MLIFGKLRIKRLKSKPRKDQNGTVVHKSTGKRIPVVQGIFNDSWCKHWWHFHSTIAIDGGGEEVRWPVTTSGRGWGLRGDRQDGGGQGSLLHSSGSDSAVGGPACSALCSHVCSVGRGGGKARRAGLLGGGGAAGRRCVRLVGGQWELCAAELTLARAGGGEDKIARSPVTDRGRRPQTVDGVERGTPGTGDVGCSSKAAHRQASNAG